MDIGESYQTFRFQNKLDSKEKLNIAARLRSCPTFYRDQCNFNFNNINFQILMSSSHSRGFIISANVDLSFTEIKVLHESQCVCLFFIIQDLPTRSASAALISAVVMHLFLEAHLLYL